MPCTVLYQDREMIEENANIYGSNRVRPNPYLFMIAGAANNKSEGELIETDYKEIKYDALQKFPDDRLAQALKPAATEIATADIVPSMMSYHKAAEAVMIVISNLKKVSTTNAKASIVNSLWKQWDVDGIKGTHGNIGVVGTGANPNVITLAEMPGTTIKETLAAVGAGTAKLKEAISITDNDLNDVFVGYTSAISTQLASVYGDEGIGRKLFDESYPDISRGEIPSYISDLLAKEYIEIVYRPMVTLWHGATPSNYADQDGDFKLSKKSLFVYETAMLELEDKCIVRIPLKTTP